MRRRLHSCNNGQAFVEFAFVFPFLLFIIMAIIQFGFIFSAKQMVNYAAFSAARSLIVMRDADRAHKAAAIACLPVSPPITILDSGIQGYIDSNNLPFSDHLSGVAGYIDDFIQDTLDSLIADTGPLGQVLAIAGKYAYSYYFTKVEVINASGNVVDPGDIGVNKDVTARVTHYFYLYIPFVNAIIGQRGGSIDWDQEGIDLGTFGSFINFGDDYFLRIRSSCTLTMEMD